MTVKTRTRKAAEKVLQNVRDRYPDPHPEYASPDDQPKILPGSHEALQTEDAWVISWESGPFEWALRYTMGGFDDEMYHLAVDEIGQERARAMATEDAAPRVDGVFVEPINSFSLGVYPD
jgi:hypothetical protein